MTEANQPISDTLNEKIGVLTRRETEARILAPIIEALGQEFGRKKSWRSCARRLFGLPRSRAAS